MPNPSYLRKTQNNMPSGIYKHPPQCGFQKGYKAPKGSSCPAWKGKNAGYNAIHQWIKKNYGQANRCENKKCVYPRKNKAGEVLLKPGKFDWALLHGKEYDHERSNFIMLCTSCHRKYDRKIEKIEL